MSKTHVAGPRFIRSCAKCGEDILPGQAYRRAGNRRYHHSPDCAHAIAMHCAEPPPVPDESKVRFHNKDRTRLLRSYEGMAQVDHDCYACSCSRYVNQQMESTIFAGWRYIAEVWIIRGRLEVRFFHDSCPFDPYEEDQRLKEEEEREMEIDDWGEEELPLAA